MPGNRIPPRPLSFWRLVMPVLALLGLAACSGADQIAGAYEATIGPAAAVKKLVLHLKPDGEGDWTVDGETVPFKWERKSNALLLHAKGGGVITGTLHNDELGLELPAVGKITLRKARN